MELSSQEAKRFRILIVDDLEENLLSVEHLLKSEGYLIDKALNGEEALKKALNESYCLFLLDVQMPGMDGFEVAHQLKAIKRTRDVPIIFNTATSKEVTNIKKGFAKGAVDYIAKPIDPDLLQLKVRAFIKLFHQQQELKAAREELQQMNRNLENMVLERTEQLSNKNKQLEKALHMGRMGFWEWNTKTNEMTWSDEMFELFGFDRNKKNLSFESLFENVHPEGKSEVMNTINWHLLSKEPFSYEYRGYHASGELMDFWVMANVIMNKKGEAIGVSGITQDITERKKAEEAIKKSEEKYRTVVETINEGLLQISPEMNVVFVNDIFRQITGLTKNKILDKKVADVFGLILNEENINEIKGFLKTAGKFNKLKREFSFMKNGQDECWISFQLVPLTSDDKSFNGYLITVSDITQNKKAEKELLRLNKELVHQNKDLRQFSYIVSHNLRSPVSNILGLTALYKKDNPAEDLKEQIIEKLEKATKLLDSTIKDINTTLSYRKSSNEIKEELDLKALMDMVTETLESEIETSKAKINCKYSVKSVYSIKSYLLNILVNLISNAIKYRVQDKAPVINFHAKVSGKYICFIVKDNGLGIDMEKQKHKLFGLYNRFHLHVEGKGMGLYLVKTQAEMLGGKVEVESQPGKGAEFRVYIRSS